jgi:hypothetical protein
MPQTIITALQQASNRFRIAIGVSCARQTFTDAAVTELVNTTALALQQNASDTLNHINAGEAPYRNATDPGLYVFVHVIALTLSLESVPLTRGRDE